MIKAIFYKEWIKCRALILLLLSLAVAQVAYLFINNANLLRTSGAIAIWSQIAEGGFSLFTPMFNYFMPLAALAISLMQYSHEMANKRFKLTLHLPCSEAKIIGSMQLFGVTALCVIYLILLVPSFVGLTVFYPSELVWAMISSIVPYMAAGVACYFFAMWVAVEPIWSRRVVYFFIALGALSTFNIRAMLGAHAPMLLSLAVVVASSIVAAYYSASRFKDGAQK